MGTAFGRKKHVTVKTQDILGTGEVVLSSCHGVMAFSRFNCFFVVVMLLSCLFFAAHSVLWLWSQGLLPFCRALG